MAETHHPAIKKSASKTRQPILYSFRRCPYAMRARMALVQSQQRCIIREIVLRNKPDAMISISPKATVPVLQLENGQVLDESLDIMMWALNQNDPDEWLMPENATVTDMQALIAENDGPFKNHLDRYKYTTRFGDDTDPEYHRHEGAKFLKTLNDRLDHHDQLFGPQSCLGDFAIFPFVRQFANTDRDWFDAHPLPHLQKWLTGHLTSELFQTIMKKWPLWQPETADGIELALVSTA